MHGYMYNHMGWWGWILMVIFWALVIAGIVFLITSLTGKSRSDAGGRDKSARDILKERYARGEISREQFEQMKKDIE